MWKLYIKSDRDPSMSSQVPIDQWLPPKDNAVDGLNLEHLYKAMNWTNCSLLVGVGRRGLSCRATSSKEESMIHGAYSSKHLSAHYCNQSFQH